MPDALWFTDDPKACKLLATDPFALLVGFAIDQQVTVQKAFAGPLRAEAARRHARPEEARRSSTWTRRSARRRRSTASPARWRAACASWPSVVAEEYGGNAARIWDEAKNADDLRQAPRRAARATAR